MKLRNLAPLASAAALALLCSSVVPARAQAPAPARVVKLRIDNVALYDEPNGKKVREYASGQFKDQKVAISPMVGERAFSGPAAELMAAKGVKPTSEGVARLYRGVIDSLIIDETDSARAPAIERAGVACVRTSTLMKSRDDEARLAKVAMEA